MQTNPALPWEAGEGGTIQLRNAVTADLLAAGLIKLGLNKNGATASSVRFVKNDDVITVMAGGDTVFGVTISENGTTISLGYIYNDNSYNLEDVSVETPLVAPDGTAYLAPLTRNSYDEYIVYPASEPNYLNVPEAIPFNDEYVIMKTDSQGQLVPDTSSDYAETELDDLAEERGIQGGSTEGVVGFTANSLYLVPIVS